MKKSDFRNIVKEQISKILKENDSSYPELQTGDKVKIPSKLNDPLKMNGQEGEVIFIDDSEGVAVVKFQGWKVGSYDLHAFEDPETRVGNSINEEEDPNSQIFNLVEYALKEVINDNSEYADIYWKYGALEDIIKKIAKHLNITKIDEASEEEVANQKELNKELEKTADIKKQIDPELNEKKEEEDVYDMDDEKEPPKSAITKKDSVSTLANKLQQTKKEMQSVLNLWKKAEGPEKIKYLNRLKELTNIKKELEKSL